ncbi:MAG: alanine racemase [Lachnospiraceae bacterium]|jgi:alanine racemase
MDYERTAAIVDLGAIRANMLEFRRRAPADKKLMAVVKTNGYGLGAVPVVRAVSDLVWGCATATIDEAVELCEAGVDKPVLVLGYVSPSRYGDLVKYGIRCAMYDAGDAELLSETAQKMGKKAIVHIKVDTGMNRIGIRPEEVPGFARKLAGLPGITTEGMFSHLATADCADRTPSLAQIEKFRGAIRALEAIGLRPQICHIGNSAAAMEMKDIPGDMFRIGISLYGYYPSDEMNRGAFPLRPSLTLKTRVIYVKTVPAGTAIGYGGTFVTEHESVIATVGIGYGDGYPRSASGRGQMIVHGRRAPIAGRVCMDQTMLDVTGIPDVKTGDEVTAIGRDGDAGITLEDLAEVSGRFHYEILCDINPRVPRIYLPADNGE